MQETFTENTPIFVANLLNNGQLDNISTNTDVCAFLNEKSLEALNGYAITEPSEESNIKIARMMAQETIWNISRSDKENSLNWYTSSIDNMIGIAGAMHPEITNDQEAFTNSNGRFKNSQEAQTVLFAAIAITSQNNKVSDNMRYALKQYRHFVTHGSFDVMAQHGSKAPAISANLSRFNNLYELSGKNLTRTRNVLTMKLKMSDLRNIAARHNIKIPNTELSDELVYGSMIFGPKVGNGFFQNLIGNHNPITIDMWFMRTWGRYTGTLLRGTLANGSLDRLIEGLSKSMKSDKMKELMKDADVLIDPNSLKIMNKQELLLYSRKLRSFWEGIRRSYISGTMKNDLTQKTRKVKRSNEDVSKLKKHLSWPLAAETIIEKLGDPVDQPKNASHRKWIRQVTSIALEILKDKGYNMTSADMQATLWYPEKEIYSALSGRSADNMNTSYDEAIIQIAKAEGYDEETLYKPIQPNGSGRGAGCQFSEINELSQREGYQRPS